MLVRLLQQRDLESAAHVHGLTFIRQSMSYEWLECSFKAYPRIMLYVIEIQKQVAGYIIWAQKSGFRSEVVLELDQLAVHPDFQGKGVGKQLIKQSLAMVKETLTSRGAVLKHIIVTTRADNFAQALYKKTLGAEVETVIRNLHSADEVLMVARNV